jgi:hypothetical protein
MSVAAGTGAAGEGGNAGAGGAGAGGTPPPPAAAAAPTDWTSGLNDDLKGYVQTKGFKDPVSVLDSYRNLEKLVGVPKERLLKLPEKDDAPEWNEIYGKLGRPEKPEEYKLPMPEKGGSEEFSKWAQTTFHGLGLSRKQGEQLVAKWNEFQGGTQKSLSEAQAVKLEAENTSLKREWGAAFEQNAAAVEHAAKEFGMNEKQLLALKEVMGPSSAMKFLHAIGSKISEAPFLGTGDGGSRGNNGALTPAAARHRIAELGGDGDFMRRYAEGGASERAEMERLHKWGYPSSS